MDRWGRRGRLGAALVVAAAALSWSAPADAAGWTAVTGATSIVQEVGKVRAPDGTLHVVWTRATPGSPTTQDVIHVAIAANGAVGTPSTIASAFAGAGNPAIVITPGGGLEVFFGAIQCTTGCPIGLFTATSSDRGASWTTPALLLNADQAYASDMSAATLSDGTPFETWSHSTGITVHRGLDPASPDVDYQGAMNAGCCGSQSNLAADAAGHMQLAWNSSATGFLGVWSRAVDPATGAPAGAPELMPGTVTSFNGAPNHGLMNGSRVPIVAAPGKPGRFLVAYPGGYPTLSRVLLWEAGATTATTIIDEPQRNHDVVALSADAVGRLWVFWANQTSSGPHVFARRVSSAGLEPVIDIGAPVGAGSIYALDGDIGPSGDPEALALVALPNGTTGTYYARASQTAAPPPPQSGRAVDVSPASGIVLVKVPGQKGFTRLTAGEQIPVGSTVDATHGRVTLSSARALKGGTQTASFYEGAFVIGQRRGQALTTLKLAGGNFRSCGRRAGDLGPVAGVARRRPRRRLWGSGSGSFSTSGNSASATVRGTIWLTEDDCEGTLIKVNRGIVTVKDLVRHKTILVRAPHSYFAAR